LGCRNPIGRYFQPCQFRKPLDICGGKCHRIL
jgi:hypothetical protein